MYLLSGSFLDIGGKYSAALTGYCSHWRYLGTVSSSILGSFNFGYTCSHCMRFGCVHREKERKSIWLWTPISSPCFLHYFHDKLWEVCHWRPMESFATICCMKRVHTTCHSIGRKESKPWILYEMPFKKKKSLIKLSNLGRGKKKKHLVHSGLGAV